MVDRGNQKNYRDRNLLTLRDESKLLEVEAFRVLNRERLLGNLNASERAV